MEKIITKKQAKEIWHTMCVHQAFGVLLESTFVGSVMQFSPIPFEIIGSKKFIAHELGKKLDNPEASDDYFKRLANHRNQMKYIMQKTVIEYVATLYMLMWLNYYHLYSA